MIELSNLSAGYGKAPVIGPITARFMPGQVTVLTGPNGCGKSTLLKSCAGLLSPSAGKILLCGQALSAMPPAERAKTVGLLAQSRAVPQITARRLVLHGRFAQLSCPRRYRPEDFAAADAALARAGADNLASAELPALSGGERQRVYLAMLLAQNPPVVLLDEPTVYLDIRHQLLLPQLAHELAAEGRTVVMVLHDLNLALSCADRLGVMQAGQLVFFGPPRELPGELIERVFGVRPVEGGAMGFAPSNSLSL